MTRSVLSRPFPRISIVRCKFLRIIMVPHADRRFVLVLPVCLSAYSTLCIPFYNQMPSASPALSRISLCFFLLKPPSTRLYDLSSKSFNSSSSISPFGLTEFQCWFVHIIAWNDVIVLPTQEASLLRLQF